MRLNFKSRSKRTILGFIERQDDGSISCDRFGRQMLKSAWTPECTTEQDCFNRYLFGWNRNTHIIVERDGPATVEVSSSSEVPATRE